MKEEMKINKEKENPSYSVSDSGSWMLGSTRYQEQRGKKMREEKMIGKVRRKYTSERKNSFLLMVRLPLARDRLGIIPFLMIGRNVGDV